MGRKAIILGGLVATVPDLDNFLSHSNVIDEMTYHRGFSHSLIIQTAVSPILALAIRYIIPATKTYFMPLLATLWLCLITHSLLDSLTTYGTQLLWPFANHSAAQTAPLSLSPIAYPSIFIIDPLYTSLLLVGILCYLLFRSTPQKAIKSVQLGLMLSTLYLAAGISAHMLVFKRAETHPLLAGKQIHVQPTPFNMLYWQILAIDAHRYYTGLTSLARLCTQIDISSHPRRPHPPADLTPSYSVRRLEWFTNGFYSYQQVGKKLVIKDLRIGVSPFFPFTFSFAAQTEDNGQAAFIKHKPKRLRPKRDINYLKNIYSQAAQQPKGC